MVISLKHQSKHLEGIDFSGTEIMMSWREMQLLLSGHDVATLLELIGLLSNKFSQQYLAILCVRDSLISEKHLEMKHT